MKTVYLILLIASLGTFAGCSLLEMSQSLWSQLLAGGLKKVGSLDPLRVPIIKVDQAEGNTTYRMMLKNVEIRGLNDSTLESVHIERGKLKSNLSEVESGYVTYSDLSGLDAIRYRFHTLVRDSAQNRQSETPTVMFGQPNQAGSFERVRQDGSRFSNAQSGQYVSQEVIPTFRTQ